MSSDNYEDFIAALISRNFDRAEDMLKRHPVFINTSRELRPNQYTLSKFSRTDRLDVFAWLLESGADVDFSLHHRTVLEQIFVKEETVHYLDVLVDQRGLDVLRCSNDVERSKGVAAHSIKPWQSGAMVELLRSGRVAPLAHLLVRYPSLALDEGPGRLIPAERDMRPPQHWAAMARRLANDFPNSAERAAVATLLESFVAAHEAHQAVAKIVAQRSQALP